MNTIECIQIMNGAIWFWCDFDSIYMYGNHFGFWALANILITIKLFIFICLNEGVNFHFPSGTSLPKKEINEFALWGGWALTTKNCRDVPKIDPFIWQIITQKWTYIFTYDQQFWQILGRCGKIYVNFVV